MMGCTFSSQSFHFLTNTLYGSLKRMKTIPLDYEVGKNELCRVCSTHRGDTKCMQNISRKTCWTHRERGRGDIKMTC